MRLEATKLTQTIKDAARVYLCGNGGSAVNAMHFANDLVAMGIRAYALTDVATMTRIANDHGYDKVFSEQLGVHAEPDDLLIVMSGSGNSPNIIKAVEKAIEIGMRSVAIVGASLGQAGAIADEVYAMGDGMQAAENEQLVLAHEVYLCLQRLKQH